MIDEIIKQNVRSILDYPKKGVIFRDITPLINNSKAFSMVIDALAEKMPATDLIAGIEARGFIFGSALAYKAEKGFIPVRKTGKLPSDKISKTYALEYGTETIEIHKDSLKNGKRVVIIDDLLATGGTTEAAIGLIKQLGGSVEAAMFVIELEGLNGRSRLNGINTISLCKY